MKQVLQRLGNTVFQTDYPAEYVLAVFGLLIFVEVMCHRNLITHFSFLLVYPRIGSIGQNLSLKIAVNVLGKSGMCGLCAEFLVIKLPFPQALHIV